MADKRKKVALIIEAIRWHEREVMRGIAKYARSKTDWVVFHLDKIDNYYNFNPARIQHYLRTLIDWKVDGVITRYPEEFAPLKEKGIPVISTKQLQKNESTFVVDNRQVGIMGAEYFLARCFKHFGFCGFEDIFWSDVRNKIFTEKVNAAGFDVASYKILRDKKLFSWDLGQKMLADWLLSLPKPVAIMACNDDCAEHVLDAAKSAGIYVPEQMAVLGVSNDDIVCEFTDPPLSSIVFNSQQAGYNAAVLLEQLMAGKKPSCTTIQIKPVRVIERRSTDFLAVEDKAIAQAVDYIRKNSSDIIQVEKIAEHVGLSLRVLQSRFHEVMGFTLRDELRRARLDYIISLLLDTSLSIDNIASMTGYSTTYNLIRFFKDEMGVSPGQYRKANLGV